MSVEQERLERYRKMLDAQSKKSNENDSSYWKARIVKELDDSGNLIHLLPIEGWPDPFLHLPEHRLVIKGSKFDTNGFICPRGVGLPCPCCEILDILPPRPKDAKDKAIKKALYLGSRWHSLMVDLEEEELVVRLYGYKVTVWRQIMGLILNPAWPDLADPFKGPAIYVKRTGENMETVYAITPVPRYGIGAGMAFDTPADPALIKRVLADAAGMDIAALLPIETYETLEAAMSGAYDEAKAKALRAARDASGKGPQRLAALPDEFSEQRLAEWIAADEKKRGGKSAAAAPPVSAPPAQSAPPVQSAPPAEDGSFEFGANLVGRKVEVDEEGTKHVLTLKSWTEADGYVAVSEDGKTEWDLPDQSYFELLPEEQKRKAPPKRKTAEAAPQTAPPAGTPPKPPVAMTGEEVTDEATRRLKELRGKK